MKSSTLIVRLVGIYLTYRGLAALYFFWQFDRQAALLAQKPLAGHVNNLLAINILGMIAGLVLLVKAGRIASLLTSDAEE